LFSKTFLKTFIFSCSQKMSWKNSKSMPRLS